MIKAFLKIQVAAKYMQHFALEKTVSIATSTRMSGVQYEDSHDMQNEQSFSYRQQAFVSRN